MNVAGAIASGVAGVVIGGLVGKVAKDHLPGPAAQVLTTLPAAGLGVAGLLAAPALPGVAMLGAAAGLGIGYALGTDIFDSVKQLGGDLTAAKSGSMSTVSYRGPGPGADDVSSQAPAGDDALDELEVGQQVGSYFVDGKARDLGIEAVRGSYDSLKAAEHALRKISGANGNEDLAVVRFREWTPGTRDARVDDFAVVELDPAIGRVQAEDVYQARAITDRRHSISIESIGNADAIYSVPDTYGPSSN